MNAAVSVAATSTLPLPLLPIHKLEQIVDNLLVCGVGTRKFSRGTCRMGNNEKKKNGEENASSIVWMVFGVKRKRSNIEDAINVSATVARALLLLMVTSDESTTFAT